MTAENSRESYLHGYSKTEQERLRYQARLLEPWVYDFINLGKVRNLLEVGCGVGAQTEILLQHYKKMKITGVDISDAQLATAKQMLARPIKQGRVNLVNSDATKMPFKDKTFDGAFICWFLEHVPSPLKVLQETRAKLKPGAVIYCTEVQNAGMFVDPYSPALLKYWFHYNELQMSLQGHPFVGATLGSLLKEAGFKKIEHNTQTMLFDRRDTKKRAKFIAYFTELMMSGSPLLLKSGRIDAALLDEVKSEMEKLAKEKNSVVFFPFCRAKAYR